MTEPTYQPPITFGVTVTTDQGHIHFDLFAGRTPDSRGRCGSLVMQADEFAAFVSRLNPETVQPEHIEEAYRA